MNPPIKYRQNSNNPNDGFILLDNDETLIGIIEVEEDAKEICDSINNPGWK